MRYNQLTLFMLLTSASSAALANPAVDMLQGGKIIFDSRLRYENVDQANLPLDGQALTTRVRFGYETAAWQGLKFLAEGEGTWAMTPDLYNNTYNGKTRYGTIADPGQLELNRAQVSYTGIRDFQFIGGRQRIILDNARFIGNAGFRQNEQTFDAAQLSYTGIKKAKITYAYVWSARRVFGRNSPVGKFGSDSHLVNATYQVIPQLKVTGYGYFLDLENKNGTVTTVSTQTFGARGDGKYKIGDVELSYAGEFARQKDYGNNPRNFSLDYYLIEGGAAAKGFSATAGYEVLDGNGVQGFSTPLATLFAFNGWNDVFLNTPGAGLTDAYVKLGYRREKVGILGTIGAQVHYHDYKRSAGTGSYGKEWNALLTAAPNKHLSFEARYASYDGKSGPFPDRDKIWFSVSYLY